MSSFRSILPQVSKAEPNSHGKAIYTATQLKAKVAPAVIEECLKTAKTSGFTTRDIFEAVPEIKAAYDTPNALGTCLGTGIKGTGMGLHSAKGGTFARCQENAVLAAGCLMTDEDFEALAGKLGFENAEALAEAMTSLPTIL
jgi:hypothetical protein